MNLPDDYQKRLNLFLSLYPLDAQVQSTIRSLVHAAYLQGAIDALSSISATFDSKHGACTANIGVATGAET